MKNAKFAKACDGVGREELEDRLTAAEYTVDCLRRHNEELRGHNKQAHEQLTTVQQRCTELLLEKRLERRLAEASLPLRDVLADVVWERGRQDEKFGPIGTTHKQDAMAISYGTGSDKQKSDADYHRKQCDAAFELGVGTWAHVLREEVAEALAESEPGKLRKELVQCAAVCAKWCEIIDRRGS